MINDHQSEIQRGFTAGVSPLNAALILEEVTRKYKDQGDPVYFIFLDAKSTFDVVDHTHLMRQLYHTGVDNTHWSLIDDMHQNASSIVKWAGDHSDPFEVNQGVRQGGILSADLYKIHINPALERLKNSGVGYRIGDIFCGATACADDRTVGSKDPNGGQVMLSVLFNAWKIRLSTGEKCYSDGSAIIEQYIEFYRTWLWTKLYKTVLSQVSTTAHLGIKRSMSLGKLGTKMYSTT